MKRYTVVFTQYYEYEVKAHNEDAAFDEAYEEFRAEMSRPIARTGYDDVDIERILLDDDDEEEDTE